MTVIPDLLVFFFCLCLSIATAPSSYFGVYGRSVFEIRAFIDTPDFSTDYKTGRPVYIFILNPLNLNDVPHIQVRNLFGDWGYFLLLTTPVSSGFLGGLKNSKI